MIQFTKNKPKAVGLISGGLDSLLAAKVIVDLGVEVYGLYFSMPWGCCSKEKALAGAENLGIKMMILQLDESYLEMVKNPKYGYGVALNPCRDCRIHMFARAREYMKTIGAEFVFTGEVLGQRPMSQMRQSMKMIEEGSGLQGKLVRPLCAQLLEPTLPEQQGIIDRKKLLNLSGRSRKDQIKLAEDFAITDYLPPAGGCLLTDENFARRMQDTLDHGYRNFRETISLKWGRHFRISQDFKAILGRDEEENVSIKSFAHKDDYIFELSNKLGPTLLLKGPRPSPEVLEICAGLVQRFSKFRQLPDIKVEYWPATDKEQISAVTPKILSDEYVEQIYI